MASGCVAEVDMFMVYRHELPPQRCAPVLRHIASCALCHDVWRRFELDERIAQGIQCALKGDTQGADEQPGWGLHDELPDRLEIPGFDIRAGYIEGGQARVYRGVYQASQEEVAIKVFHNSLLNEGGQERFSREIKSLARLRHPNVITIRSDGQVEGHAYFVMPWIDSLTLDDYIKSAPLSYMQKVRLVGKICDAVSHAHQRGVMHLDLKPTNVRVDSSGEPIVMDFGLARLIESDLTEASGRSLGAAGTPLYMAPEQIDNRDDLDVRADVYGLGLLVYEALVGRRAKGAQLTRTQLPSLDIAREEPPAPRSVAPKLPRELAAIITRAIEVDPDRRYQTAQALHDDLRAYQAGKLVQARAHQRSYRMRKWIQLHREAVVALGLIGMIMAFGVATRLYLTKVAEDRLADVEAMREETFARLVQSEQEARPHMYTLSRTLNYLIDAFEETELLASENGNWELADACFEKAERIRAQLEELAPTPVPTEEASP
ncbi:MAG: serine/threonine protein kinase [bacterium]|nr:serine/threonine protein kinase [bacterium]